VSSHAAAKTTKIRWFALVSLVPCATACWVPRPAVPIAEVQNTTELPRVEPPPSVAPAPSPVPQLTVMPAQLRPPTTPLPAWTTGHRLSIHGDLLYAVDVDNGALVIVDRTQLVVKSSLPVGIRPSQVVVAADGTAFVGIRQTGEIVRISPVGMTTRWSIGSDPVALALSPDGSHLFVALAGDRQLVTLDAQTGLVLDRRPVRDRPRAVAALAQSVLVVHQSGPALRFALGQASPLGQGVPQVPGVPIDLQTTAVDDGCGPDAEARATRAQAVAVHPETGEAYVAHVVARPGDGEAVAHAGPAGNVYAAVAVNCGIGPTRPVQPAVSVLPSDDAEPRATPTVDLPVPAPGGLHAFASLFDQPADLALHPDHRLLLVAATGTDNVLALAERPGGALQPVAEFKVGQAPTGLAIAPDGHRAYTLDSQTFTISELDLDPLLSQTGPFQPLHLTPVRVTKYGTDPLPLSARLGRRTFTFAGNPRVSEAGAFACATCHIDGTEDQQTWFIADGPRQTPSLAGRLAGTSPYNWRGSEALLQDNMRDTVQRMGGGGLQAAELTSLHVYLLVGLTPPPTPTLPVDAIARGQAVFQREDVGCAGCHVAPTFTDGQSHDVGTATEADIEAAVLTSLPGKAAKMPSFDTPSLHGLHHTAPYLHDGSAPTLEAVLTQTQGTMGHTDSLTDAERQDLIAYLQSL
jgi:DNA-binding beta-propeller fold protein YncE